MAAPLVISFWMRALFTFVDTAYAAYLGDAAVASIGLSIPLEFMLIAFWVGVSTGLTSNLSLAMGARGGARIEQLLATAKRIVWALVLLFAALAVGVSLGAGSMGLEPEVARLFAIYAGVLVGGSALTGFWSIIPDSIVKAHQDTRSTMWAGIWSNLINVVLNTLFMFVFHWGVFGIALSTVLGRFGGLVYAQRRAASHEAACKARGLDTSPALDPAPLRSILVLAIPAALTYTLMAVETLLVNWLLAGQPQATESIAAYGIYYRFMLFALMPVIAAAVAILPYVARRYGERDFDSIRRGLRQIFATAVAYCVLLVAPFLIATAPLFARLLAESQVTADLTRVVLWLCPLACLVMVPFQLLRPAFEGLQRGWPGLVMAVLRYVILAAPAALAGREMALRYGMPALHGIVAGLILASALSSFTFMVWMVRVLGGLERKSRAPRGAAGEAAMSIGTPGEPDSAGAR